MNKNSNRTIIITGSSSGIGRSLALNFAKPGYNVVINFRKSTEDAASLKKEIESAAGNCKIIQADLTRFDEAERLVKETINHYGKIDVLINGVGDYIKKSIDNFEIDEWEYMIGSNLNSVFYMIKSALPHLRENGWGRIINFGISGIEKLIRDPEMTAYNAAKAGVLMLTEAFAQTEAKYGITVNMISPGIIDNRKYSDTYKDRIIKEIPAGKIGTPDDVLNVIKFLISGEADYINGANINVSGGFFIT
ncbi:SDR family NAD(P)-dependent oxidoreductase [candidate division KSB1 bacterium]